MSHKNLLILEDENLDNFSNEIHYCSISSFEMHCCQPKTFIECSIAVSFFLTTSKGLFNPINKIIHQSNVILLNIGTIRFTRCVQFLNANKEILETVF